MLRDVRQRVTVHLIGLNHGYQLRGSSEMDWAAFDAYLFHFCRVEKTDLVAEEMSEEGLRLFRDEGATGSVPRDVAMRLGVRHLFCDPDSVERTRLGIPSGKEGWAARERRWWQKLREVNFTRCAFVLGAQHVDRFATLLASEGIDARTESKNWEFP